MQHGVIGNCDHSVFFFQYILPNLIPLTELGHFWPHKAKMTTAGFKIAVLKQVGDVTGFTHGLTFQIWTDSSHSRKPFQQKRSILVKVYDLQSTKQLVEHSVRPEQQGEWILDIAARSTAPNEC